MEAQAIGRAHRMGQEETVEVYRLVTKGTIEENSGNSRTKETSGVTSIGWKLRVTW